MKVIEEREYSRRIDPQSRFYALLSLSSSPHTPNDPSLTRRFPPAVLPHPQKPYAHVVFGPQGFAGHCCLNPSPLLPTAKVRLHRPSIVVLVLLGGTSMNDAASNFADACIVQKIDVGEL